MVDVNTIILFDAGVGVVGALTMGYLLYSETLVVAYPRFFKLATFGLLVFSLTGPAAGEFQPALLHAVHGTAGLFVCVALFDLVADELGQDDEFATFGMDAGSPPTGGDSPEDD